MRKCCEGTWIKDLINPNPTELVGALRTKVSQDKLLCYQDGVRHHHAKAVRTTLLEGQTVNSWNSSRKHPEPAVEARSWCDLPSYACGLYLSSSLLQDSTLNPPRERPGGCGVCKSEMCSAFTVQEDAVPAYHNQQDIHTCIAQLCNSDFSVLDGSWDKRLFYANVFQRGALISR